MPQIRAFISDNIKSLTIVASFLISMYIQHLNNTTRIDALADRCDRIELRLEDQYQKYYDRLIEIDLSALEPYLNGQQVVLTKNITILNDQMDLGNDLVDMPCRLSMN